jgi:hypothetical protein
MKVQVSGKLFVFPPACACCNGKPDTENTVSCNKDDAKNTWTIPYCQVCLTHIKEGEKAKAFAGGIGLLGLFIGGYLWYAVHAILGIPVALAGLITATVIYHKRTAKAKRSGCACLGQAVAYLGWEGFIHAFDFASLKYALAFMVANERKLVNLSGEALDLLRTRQGIQYAPQSAKRSR